MDKKKNKNIMYGTYLNIVLIINYTINTIVLKSKRRYITQIDDLFYKLIFIISIWKLIDIVGYG